MTQVDRCTVRLMHASPTEAAEVEAEARRRLADVQVDRLELNERGDRVASLELRDTPAPAKPPATPAEIQAAAVAALTRYAGLFGAPDLPRATFTIKAHQGGDLGWQVLGSIAYGQSQQKLVVGLGPSGAPQRIMVTDAARPPDGICPQPGLDLDDPRIVTTVVGATVQVDAHGPHPREIQFTGADISAINNEIVRPERDVFRRVIAVQLQADMWTAWLDADTAALIRVVANFDE